MPTNKAALFAFNGEPMCFVHVLLNAFDLQQRGWEVQIVLEGTATRLAQQLGEDPSLPFAALYLRARDGGLIAGVCKACASKLGARQSAEAQGLALLDDMQGHPSVGRFREQGWEVFTF